MNKNTKDKKFQRKGKPCDKRGQDKIKSDPNDKSWYTQSPFLADAVASLPYGRPTGSTIEYNPNSAYDNQAIPGILTVSTIPCMGKSTSLDSAIMLAARSIYSYVRHKNSGASNYEENDLMLYIATVDSMFSFYAHLLRAYAVACTYKANNWYWAKDILYALGFDAPSLIGDLAGFRSTLITFGLSLQRFSIPVDFPLLKRHAWMYSNIFYEDPVTKGQLICYVPEHFFKYAWNKYETGSALEPCYCRHESTDYTVSSDISASMIYHDLADIRSLIDEMTEPIFRNTDIAIMSGDIEKAYGSGAIMKIEPVPAVVRIEPLYSEEVLSQFANATCVGLPRMVVKTNGFYRCDMYCNDAGAILYNPEFQTPTKINESGKNKVITMYKNDVDSADTLVATRAMVFTEGAIPIGNFWLHTLDSFASDIACVAEVWGRLFNPSNAEMQLYHDTYISCTDDTHIAYGQSVNDVAILARIARFNFRPTIMIYNSTNDRFIADFRDIDNWAVISADTLRAMHDNCILSMLNIPNQGFWAPKS